MGSDTQKNAAFERAPLFLLPVLIGIVQIAGYYISAMLASPDGTIPVAQPDTLLYCHAARRICEGAPFSFSIGTAASTGTTSVLHPFFLAAFYALGFTGDALLSAGFWFNAVCYLVFLFGWAMALDRWTENYKVKFLGVVLLALNGQSAYCALAQSDIGLWLAVSALIVATLPDRLRPSRARTAVFAALLTISPWVRPEGMMLVFAFSLVHGMEFLKVRSIKCLVSCVARFTIPVLSVIGVFAFNYWLTGEAQFSSVAHKGYLKNFDFAPAVMRMFQDGWTMFRSLLLAMPDSLPRNLMTVPLIGGVAFITGLAVHSWRRERVPGELAVIIACGLGFLSVANSQFQGTNMDRYLAWAIPLVVLFTAEGVIFFYERLNNRPAAVLIPLVFVGYTLCASVVCFCVFSNTCRFTDRLRSFARACETVMPKGASIAATGECGIAYYMSDRRVAQLSGLYSPEFEYMSMDERMDDLKLNPAKRFDYWIFDDEFAGQRKEELAERTFGPCLLSGPVSRALHRADWSAFDNAAKAPVALAGETLVGRVDVGYRPDETAADYEVIDRWSRKAAQPFYICCKDVAGRYLVDVGRVLAGGDAMTVKLKPGRDVRVVMRQLSFGSARVDDGVTRETITGKMPEKYQLNLAVDGVQVSRLELTCDQNWFSEVSFTVPGEAIRNEVTRIALLGDHIPFGYWFYQKLDW